MRNAVTKPVLVSTAASSFRLPTEAYRELTSREYSELHRREFRAGHAPWVVNDVYNLKPNRRMYTVDGKTVRPLGASRLYLGEV
jgi:hypothetical protein